VSASDGVPAPVVVTSAAMIDSIYPLLACVVTEPLMWGRASALHVRKRDRPEKACVTSLGVVGARATGQNDACQTLLLRDC
jgi:hypothetical protein